MDKEPITLNGLNRLKEELVFLKEKKRPEIVAAISRSKITWGSQRKCRVSCRKRRTIS